MVDTGIAFMDFPALAVTVIVGATVLALVYVSSLFRASTAEEKRSVAPPKKEKQAEHAGTGQKPSKKKQQHAEKWNRDSKRAFTHPWMLTSLKGHTGQILDMDFSSNGKFLATCADDRTVLVWNTRDWHQKDHKNVRVNVELDHATLVRWSPDSKAFIICKAAENVLEVYKLSKKPDSWLGGVSKALVFPKQHEEDVVGLGIACSGRFILTCSEGTELLLSDLRGQELARLDTYLMNTYGARVSPCGRFIAACGFTPDVKVWEVNFSKSGDFQNATRAFELSGHSSGVYDVAFSADSSRVATVSKDGTWKLFDINVEYKKGEDPHLLCTQKYAVQSSSPARIALSPSGDVVVVASGSSLHFFSARTGKLDKTVGEVYGGPITALLFDSAGKLVLTAGDKHVRVFHNVTGQRELATVLRERLHPSMSSAQRERMEQQINDAETFLGSLGEKI